MCRGDIYIKSIELLTLALPLRFLPTKEEERHQEEAAEEEAVEVVVAQSGSTSKTASPPRVLHHRRMASKVALGHRRGGVRERSLLV